MKACTLFFNPRCSKCREAKEMLGEKNMAVEIVEYLKNSPTEQELLALMKILVEPVGSIVRTKEEKYQELKFPLDDVKIIAKNLAKYPELIERPIVMVKNKAIVARPVEKMQEIL